MAEVLLTRAARLQRRTKRDMDEVELQVVSLSWKLVLSADEA